MIKFPNFLPYLSFSCICRSFLCDNFDYDEKKVDTCHQIDVNEIELKSIRSIKFCKNILIDDTIKTKSDFEKMPNDCKKQ